MYTKFFEEFVKATDGKFPMLKFNGASFNKRDNMLTVRFIISAFDVADFSDESKAEVLRAVERLFPGITVEVQYIRTYADNSVVKNKILEFLNKNNQMLFRSLTDKNFEITVDETDISVRILLDTPIYKMFTTGELQTELADWLERNFNQNIDLTAEEIVLAKEDDFEFKLASTTSATTDISSLRLIEVEVGDKIFSRGRVAGVNQLPNYISDVKGESDNLILCGNISNFSQRTYKNKKYNPDDSKSGPPELPLMRFMLDDTTGKMDCIFFPRPEEAESIEAALSQYTQVVCIGKASKFKDTLSYTVSAIFTAKINFDSIKLNVSKPEPERYLTVLPEDCVSMEQQSLIDGAETVNPFFNGKTLVIFDLETTSKMPDSAYIVQISALKIVDGVEKQRFDTFVKPPVHIPEDVVEVHHIDDATVANAPKIEEVIPDFFKFTRGAILVGHNVIGYDFIIINRVATEQGYRFDNELLDTLVLSRKYMQEMSNFKLTTLSKSLKIDHENAHRADSDVFATWGVLKEIARRM